MRSEQSLICVTLNTYVDVIFVLLERGKGRQDLKGRDDIIKGEDTKGLDAVKK